MPTITESLETFANRPKGLRNPVIKEFVENVLENASNPHISDADLLPYVLHQVRSIDIRIEPYTNSPIKGIVSVPLEDASLDGVREELALALTGVMRRAFRNAALKVLVDHQPG